MGWVGSWIGVIRWMVGLLLLGLDYNGSNKDPDLVCNINKPKDQSCNF